MTWEGHGNCLGDATLLGLLLLDLQRGLGGCLEHLPHALLTLGGALQVGEGVDLLSHGPTLLRLHRLLLHLGQLLDRVGIVSKILFVANKDDGDVGTEVFDLRSPFLRDVLERVGGVYAEAHQDDVGVGVGEGPQSVVVLLTGRVPKCELDLST